MGDFTIHENGPGIKERMGTAQRLPSRSLGPGAEPSGLRDGPPAATIRSRNLPETRPHPAFKQVAPRSPRWIWQLISS